MPVINVALFRGRSAAQKRELARVLTEAYIGVCGGKPQSVWVLFQETDTENWAVGGELASDLYPAASPGPAAKGG